MNRLLNMKNCFRFIFNYYLLNKQIIVVYYANTLNQSDGDLFLFLGTNNLYLYDDSFMSNLSLMNIHPPKTTYSKFISLFPWFRKWFTIPLNRCLLIAFYSAAACVPRRVHDVITIDYDVAIPHASLKLSLLSTNLNSSGCRFTSCTNNFTNIAMNMHMIDMNQNSQPTPIMSIKRGSLRVMT